MRQAQNGDLDVYFNRKYNDEIGDLGDSFNSMVKEIKNLLLISTGALMSTTSSLQGESIPGIAHAVAIEFKEK